jgi:hypothetical protein
MKPRAAVLPAPSAGEGWNSRPLSLFPFEFVSLWDGYRNQAIEYRLPITPLPNGVRLRVLLLVSTDRALLTAPSERPSLSRCWVISLVVGFLLAPIYFSTRSVALTANLPRPARLALVAAGAADIGTLAADLGAATGAVGFPPRAAVTLASVASISPMAAVCCCFSSRSV